jgi:hydrogenase/urease accessory protein HupE
MWLLGIALFGLLVPNGLFVYWLLNECHGLAPVLHDKLALAFVLDAFLAVGVLAAQIARTRSGRVSWAAFVALSLVGGLGFSVPFTWWLNSRPARTPAA